MSDAKTDPGNTVLVRATWEQALHGLVVPVQIYLQYTFKFAVYVAVWALLCQLNEPTDPTAPWYFQPDAFKKFVLFSLFYEGAGVGCSSGPLSVAGRSWFTPYRYFLTPGTMKLPFIEGLPIFGSHRRSWFDVALYIANNLLLVRALFAPNVLAFDHVLPIVMVSALLGLTDRAQFLCMRPEQYLYLAICFLSGPDWVAASKWVQFTIWMGAGISKLNVIFPYVTLVLGATHPFLAAAPKIKRLLMRSPDDLRPSELCHWITRVATVVEMGFPTILLLSDGGPLTYVALGVMTLFHLNIITSMPFAVPIEWNLFVLYSMYFLFGFHAADPLAVSSPLLAAFLIVALIALPVIGNLWPARTSFLIAMRYYAGNWCYSSWLFRSGGAYAKYGNIPVATQPFKLGTPPPMLMPRLSPQLNAGTLHLLSRANLLLWPKAVGGAQHLSEYMSIHGDAIARRLVGWNFGDGHLNDERLLRAVQARCKFEPGELIHIFVESQPMLHQAVEYRITDAASGLIERGEITMETLCGLQPKRTCPDTEPNTEPRSGEYQAAKRPA